MKIGDQFHLMQDQTITIESSIIIQEFNQQKVLKSQRQKILRRMQLEYFNISSNIKFKRKVLQVNDKRQLLNNQSQTLKQNVKIQQNSIYHKDNINQQTQKQEDQLYLQQERQSVKNNRMNEYFTLPVQKTQPLQQSEQKCKSPKGICNFSQKSLLSLSQQNLLNPNRKSSSRMQRSRNESVGATSNGELIIKQTAKSKTVLISMNLEINQKMNLQNSQDKSVRSLKVFEETEQDLVSNFPQVQNGEELCQLNDEFEQLLLKYKNCSFFSITQQVQAAQNPNKINVVNIQQIERGDEQINKYITRAQRPLTIQKTINNQEKSNNSQFQESKKSSNKYRMNSPVRPTLKKDQKENVKISPKKFDGATQFKKVEALKNTNKITQPDKSKLNYSDLFRYPTENFQYYQTMLQTFHSNLIYQGKKFKKEGLIRLYNNEKTQRYFHQIYEEHFLQSYQALQFCKDINILTADEQIKEKVVNLPPSKFSKTVVFDLDETLIHCQEDNSLPCDIVLQIQFPKGEIIDAHINVRPFCLEMLNFLSQSHELIVFTASHACYASKVLDYLDPDNKLISHRFYRESCVIVADDLHIKDLRVIGNRNLKDMILIDNASYSFWFQLSNGVPIIPYYDNKQDKELVYLTTYLSKLLIEKEMIQNNGKYFCMEKYSLQTMVDTLQSIFV